MVFIMSVNRQVWMIVLQSAGGEAVLTDRVLEAERIHELGPEVGSHNPCGFRVSGERERERETTGTRQQVTR